MCNEHIENFDDYIINAKIVKEERVIYPLQDNFGPKKSWVSRTKY